MPSDSEDSDSLLSRLAARMLSDSLGRVAVVHRRPSAQHQLRHVAIPALHGGVVSMLLDTAGGAAVWSKVDLTGQVSTVDLRVD